MNKKAQTTLTTKIVGGTVMILIIIGAFYLMYHFVMKPILNWDNSNSDPINQSENYSQASPCYVIKQFSNYSVIYPNTSLTPGDIATNNVSEICNDYYTKLLVAVPDDTVNTVYSEYNISSHKINEYEIDHWIPLALGGSNNLTNLWPQPKIYPGYQEKDYLQLYLRNQFCTGKISLEEARADITGDWFTLYLQVHSNHPDVYGD